MCSIVKLIFNQSPNLYLCFAEIRPKKDDFVDIFSQNIHKVDSNYNI